MMRHGRPIVIVEVFPSREFNIEVNIVGVRQQLIELGLIRSV